jgi:hypothetical protein
MISTIPLTTGEEYFDHLDCVTLTDITPTELPSRIVCGLGKASGTFSRDLVIARYYEPIEWLELVPSNCNIVVCNKGNPLNLENATMANLPNHGREAGSYLHYIISHYHSLPDLVYFVQADPFNHGIILDTLIERLGLDYREITSLTTMYRTDIPEQWIKDKDKTYNDAFGYPVRLGDANIQEHLKIKWFNAKSWQRLFADKMPDKLWFAYGACLVVPKKYILYRPIEFYQRLFYSLSDDSKNEISPWSLEALWLYIFSEIPLVKSPISDIPIRKPCNCGDKTKSLNNLYQRLQERKVNTA